MINPYSYLSKSELFTATFDASNNLIGQDLITTLSLYAVQAIKRGKDKYCELFKGYFHMS